MINNNKMSLGIDISGDCISYAVVVREKSAIKIVSAGEISTPFGAIKDGNIVDSALVAKVLKNLIAKKYRGCKSTVSLTANPLLAQIIELPEEIPGNISQFVHSEIKHSAILAGKEIQLDYCGLGLSVGVPARVFVSATEKSKMTPLLKTLSLARISPETIELPFAAWVRSIYEKCIKPKFKSNVVLVMVRDNVINLCVFRRTSFDFVRSIDASGLDVESCLKRCQTEIEAVVQYYDIEFGSGEESAWDCVIELPGIEADIQTIQSRLTEGMGMNVKVCSSQSILSDTPIGTNAKKQPTTLTAVGLALNPLKITCPNVKTNLVPNEIKESRAAKRELVIFANAVAGILIAIFIFAAFVSSQFEKTQETVRLQKIRTPLKLIETLVSRQEKIEEEYVALSKKKELLVEVLKNAITINWSEVLKDIGSKVPDSLYITKVDSVDDYGVSIKGKALTPDVVNLFSKNLDNSEVFTSSNVKEIDISSKDEGSVLYTINCIIAGSRRLYVEAR